MSQVEAGKNGQNGGPKGWLEFVGQGILSRLGLMREIKKAAASIRKAAPTPAPARQMESFPPTEHEGQEVPPLGCGGHMPR